MKTAFSAVIAIALSFSSLASASTCQDLFSEANGSSSKARQYSDQANGLFSKMKEQAQENSSDAEICSTGKDSRMSAYLSAINFRKARANWLEAIDACNAPNDKTAAEQADLNTDYYNTQAEFIASMDNLLGSRCGAKPLTPMLNN